MASLLSINNYHYVRGGAEAVFLEHNEMFKTIGWQVVPFCMRHEKNLPTKWDRFFVDEIELGRQYKTRHKLAKSLKAIYSWEATRKITDLISSVQPDIAHGHNIYHHLSPSILRCLKKHDIPTVLTLHDLKLACPSYRMIAPDGICERCKSTKYWQATRNRCMHGSLALSLWVTVEAYVHRALGSYSNTVDKFIVPSHFYIKKFREWGWDENRFVYIPNFVDSEAIRPEYQPGERFVFFGRLSPEKGVSTFIKAVAKAGVRAQIIGTGPEESNLRDLAKSERADVEFCGFRTGENLFGLLRAARAIVLPSEWYENAPISVLEAFAAGKPVLGADIGGIPELVTSERGAIFQAFSVTSLAGQLTRLLEMNDHELISLGECAREYVCKVHSRKAYLDRCLRVYRDLIGHE